MAPILISALIGLQTWTLNEIVNLKVEVAGLTEKVLAVQQTQNQNQNTNEK